MKRLVRFISLSFAGISLIFLVACGEQMSPKSRCYYKDKIGIYYSSGNNWFESGIDYLEDVDMETFEVLSSHFAKDKNWVYDKHKILEGADVASFYIDSTGLPKDINNVYIYDTDLMLFRPLKCNIDVASAHRPFNKGDGHYWVWLRDKNRVYLGDHPLDVDRSTFYNLYDWYVDKDNIYTLSWDKDVDQYKLVTVDSLQSPLMGDIRYLRNGRNIIYSNKVVLADVSVRRFKPISIEYCIVNDTLLINGKIRLKDTVDVASLVNVDRGIIFKDRNHVYFHDRIKDKLDAATFRKIGDRLYEDKNGKYSFNDIVD